MRSPAKTVENHLLRMATKQENIAVVLAILQNAMVTTVTAMKTEYRLGWSNIFLPCCKQKSSLKWVPFRQMTILQLMPLWPRNTTFLCLAYIVGLT